MSADFEKLRAPAPPDRLLTATSVVGFMTLLSRVTGLVRDVAFSSWFGSGVVMDAFTVAFKIPNLLRRFFAEGAFSQAFVPVISEYRTHRSQAEARELADRVAGTLGLGLLAVTLVGVLVAPLLILLFAPGFSGGDVRFGLSADMLRLTFPYVLFVSLTALAGSILNAYRRFAVAAFTPVLLNVVMILFAGWVAPHMARPGLGLAAGVFAAGVVQLAFQLPFLWSMGMLPRPRWGLAHEGVRRIVKLMLPAIFGSSVAQISILLDTLIASFLAAGSISWLYFSDRLVEFPLGVFGIALATVILPRLSEHHATESKETFSATLDWALRLVMLIGVPATLALAVLAEPLLTTLFHRGEFTARDVAMSAASLRAYAPGLLGFILVKVLAPGYFARQDTRAPVRAGVQSLVVGMALSVAFVVLLAKTSWAPAHAGIAAATACSALFNAALLLRGLLRSGVYRPGAGWPLLAVRVLVPGVVMTAGLLLTLAVTGDWFAMGGAARVGALAGLVAGGAAVYFGACHLCGLRFRDFRLRVAD
ncbi:MAG TPA: murein biosynthesis integral membrane protein MurJ [Gammaproteobacteria bacterium]|nr:murein biosynthesis integral membrane protein MurJ [Gammaproteobacteria bacterium]